MTVIADHCIFASVLLCNVHLMDVANSFSPVILSCTIIVAVTFSVDGTLAHCREFLHGIELLLLES